MKIYTKTGDKGTTSLVYGQRVSKNDNRVEAYGTIDEANSMIGLSLSYLKKTVLKEIKEQQKLEDVIGVLTNLQTTLFHVGAEISTPYGKEVKWKLTEEHILSLEKYIDTWNDSLPKLTQFVLPGGNSAASSLHVARTIVRRTERVSVDIENVNPLVLAYLNRLSDFLFVAARYVNFLYGEKEPVLHE